METSVEKSYFALLRATKLKVISLVIDLSARNPNCCGIYSRKLALCDMVQELDINKRISSGSFCVTGVLESQYIIGDA